MAGLLHTWLDWAHRNLAWSNSRRAWQERLGLLFVLAAASAWVVLDRELDPAFQVVFWGTVLALLAVLLRKGWLKLFGPVLLFDLVRTARRDRYFLVRGLYTLGLLGLLCWVWYVW